MNLRHSQPAEMDSIYMMGFDVWSEALPEPEYLEICHNSPKYKKGQWHVLDVNGQAVSALITYADTFNLPPNCYGIGSVATPPEFRKRGYATKLIGEVVEALTSQGAQAVYLFSDIDAAFYEKLGFERLKDSQQTSSSVCMIRLLQEDATLPDGTPSYF